MSSPLALVTEGLLSAGGTGGTTIKQPVGALTASAPSRELMATIGDRFGVSIVTKELATSLEADKYVFFRNR